MSTTLRVLLVEDSESDAKLILRELLRSGLILDPRRVEDAEAMRAALGERSWDVVLSDWSLPHFTAPSALETLRASGLDLPFIIVSGTVGEEVAAAARRAGAHDYVLKSNLTRLASAIAREQTDCAERAERRRVETALREHEARFRALIEKSEDGISLLSLDGNVIYTSPAGARLLGTTPGERLGQSLLSVIHPDDRDNVRGLLARLADAPLESLPYRTRVVLPDGSCRWIEGTATNRVSDPS
ncbi:MAG: response regulator, partial [Thermoanaerobaculia bacterium]